MANYQVEKEVLLPYLPVGTELDIWNDKCYVSLIGFLFQNVRLLGIKVPFHTNFEEVNLRFYVRYQDAGVWKRGVVFIKEIVPKFALSLVANTIYNEHYQTMPMKHSWKETAEELFVAYSWKAKGSWQSLRVRAEKELSDIATASETEFITEHYWGYARYNDRVTNEYEVKHPKWEQYQVKSYEIDVDFGLTYGDDFRFLNQIPPSSVFLAEGSEISVEKKTIIRSVV